MSQEIVKTYMLSNPDIMIPMGRKDFYEEQIQAYKTHGRPTRAVEVINIFMFNEAGELIIQKRAKNKNHNP
jgi:isopentenyldiphosphate isomerase